MHSAPGTDMQRAANVGDVLPDALRDALGQVLAEERKQWRRERELIEAQARAVIADLRAAIAELSGEVRRELSKRLMELKDGSPGAPGAPGPSGAPGPAGKLPVVKMFEPGKVYYAG